MEEQIKKLRDAGFSDSDIQEWIEEQKNKKGIAANEQVIGAAVPAEQDVPFKMEKTAVAPESNTAEALATAGTGVNSVLTSPIGHGLEAYGAYKLLAPTAKNILQKVTGAVPPSVSPTGVQITGVGSASNPIGGTAQGVTGAGETAASRAPGMLSRVAPYLETAGRLAGRLAGPAALALTPGTLNAGEDQEMARIRAIQDGMARLPKDKQNFYFTLPPEKKQQVNQMILSGQDPSGLLVPNAINTNFPNSALQRR